MPTPQPLECSVETCQFQTPAGCPTWDLMVTLLTQHSNSVHGSQSNAITQNSKLEKLPRPTFNLNMTESQWSFTKIQWDHYIGQVQAPQATILTQLQAACSEPLRQRIPNNIYLNVSSDIWSQWPSVNWTVILSS